MNRDLTQGGIAKTMLLFALPMIAGNLLQQFYNIADTWVVGNFLGKNPLAAADLVGFFYKGRKRFEKGRLSGRRS